MANKGILIVEDDPDISSSLVELLESEGYEPITASNGQQALETLRNLQRPLGMMLVDYMMPVMDGKKFLETLEEEKPGYLQITPAVFLTAAADLKFSLPQSVEMIKKPVDIDVLLNVIKKHCDH